MADPSIKSFHEAYQRRDWDQLKDTYEIGPAGIERLRRLAAQEDSVLTKRELDLILDRMGDINLREYDEDTRKEYEALIAKLELQREVLAP